MTRVYLGTSSWSEKSWDGVFYPEGTKALDQLPYYSTQFNAVEADVTYYRIPSKAMVRGWFDRTPTEFKIAAKFPRTIVHGGEAATPDATKLLLPDVVGATVEKFLEAMAELGSKCGPLVLQFPYFNRAAFSSAAPFLDRLDAFLESLPRTFRYAVEIRNGPWLRKETFEVCRRHKVAVVMVDLGYLPHPDELGNLTDLITSDFAYARLIGDRKAMDALTTKFDKIVMDQSPRLDRWAHLLTDVITQVAEVHVYANNHYAGHAPATVRDLAGRIAAR